MRIPVLLAAAVLLLRAAGGHAAAYNIRVTNITNEMFVVSWVSDAAETGSVRYGTAFGSLPSTVEDVRGALYASQTHYVKIGEIQGISASTTYYFEVVSGGVTYPGGGARFSVTTGPVTDDIPPSDQRYGRVFLPDGVTPVPGTIVYCTLSDGNASGSRGSSQALSCLVGPGDGYWTMNLGSCRSADLRSWFQYSPSGGDRAGLYAQGAGMGMRYATYDTGALPAATILGAVPLKGDANFDGVVNVEDLFIAMQMAARRIPEDVPVMDMNDDKSVNLPDVLTLRAAQ